MRANYPTTFGI